MNWLELARCGDCEDPEIFHDPDRYHQALELCAQCPVTLQCFELGKRMGGGVWGGKVHAYRTYTGGVQRYLLAPHGTAAAYRRHIRLGQKPCGRCTDGNARATALRRGKAASC